MVKGMRPVSNRAQYKSAWYPLNSGYSQLSPVTLLLYFLRHTPNCCPRSRFFHTRYGPRPIQVTAAMSPSGKPNTIPITSAGCRYRYWYRSLVACPGVNDHLILNPPSASTTHTPPEPSPSGQGLKC